MHEQAEDFARQEKILKLISTELTRNTTRVVEMAVKSEVQTSVLPSLENITRNEVRAALHEQVELGLLDNITKVCLIIGLSYFTCLNMYLPRACRSRWRNFSFVLIFQATLQIS